jgi:beta-N-acetylhexosaminidase
MSKAAIRCNATRVLLAAFALAQTSSTGCAEGPDRRGGDDASVDSAQRPDVGAPADGGDAALADGVGPLPWVEQTLQRLTLEQRVGQLLLPRYTASCATIAALQPAGVVYIGADVSTMTALREDNLALQRCAESSGIALPLLTSTNHEGGRIYYFDGAGQATRFPSARAQCDRSADYVQQVSRAQAIELRYAGLNTTLGPVADVLLVGSNVIGDRAYATTPAAAADCVRAAVVGYHEGGLLAVLKHFPGHGGTSSDTHVDFAVDPSDAQSLEAQHLVPFRAGLAAPASAELVMASHVLYQGVDPAWPATLSPAVLALLRQGSAGGAAFAGPLVTDDLVMGAVAKHWDVAQAALVALAAGSDLLLVGSTAEAARIRELLLSAAQSGWSLSTADANGTPVTLQRSAAEMRQRIDEAVRRVLAVRQRPDLQRFDAAVQAIEQAAVPDWAAHAALAAQP